MGTLPSPLDRLLECASLREGLESLVLYDATPELLEQVAEDWRARLAALGVRARTVRLGPWTTEEDLWGLDEPLPKEWRRRGLLDSGAPRLVVIPDLSRLSLAALRACVSWMGSESVAIERTGQSRRFQPRAWWLAGCAMAEVGQVSPHLLDRFALRIRAPAAPGGADEALRRALESESAGASGEEVELPEQEAERLRRAARVRVRMTDEARATVLQGFPFRPGAGHRGLLTLGRMACAVAQLADAARAGSGAAPVEVLVAHVRDAARLLQLPAPAQEDAPELKQQDIPPPPPAVPQEQVHEDPQQAPHGPLDSEQTPAVQVEESSRPPVIVEPILLSSVESQPAAVLPPLEVERDTSIQREYAPLRLPAFRGGVSGKGRGSIIGVQPATDMQDLGIVSTLLAAVPYQSIRRKKSGSRRKGLLLTRADLRSYRRAPVPQHLLALVLDFTSMKEGGWQQALMPYLSEAYVERAQICVVLVGARSDEDTSDGSELRARRVLARSLLVPAVARAFEARPGRATPLADGLELTLATLRRALRVGRGAAHHARLVVLTDGRGNIPLESSRTGVPPALVGRQGVEDALRMAVQLRGMRQVTSVLLRPPLADLKDLPAQLANALGSELVDILSPQRAEKGVSP